MMDRARIQQLIEEVSEYIGKLESRYRLTDKEIIQILNAVKENYEWED